MGSVAILIAVCAVLNAVRGGGFGADRLPWHPRWYVAAFIGLAALAAGCSQYASLVITVAYVAWSLPPWGYLQGLGRLGDDQRPGTFERVLLRLSFGNVHAALFLRHAVCSLPLVAVSIYGPVLIGAVAVAGYETGWRLTPANPVRTGELIAGAAWAIVIALVAMGA